MELAVEANSTTVNNGPSSEVAVNLHLQHESLVNPSVSEGQPDELSVAVTSQPQANNVNQLTSTSQIFTDDGEETEDSFRVAEFHLAGAHFRETGMPCCPSLEIRPTLGLGATGQPVDGWQIKSESEAGCYCCCFPRRRQWKTMKLMQNDREVLNFIYKPEVWCPAQKMERIVDIYVPGRIKRIGFIKYNSGNDFEESNAIIADTITKSIYHVTKRDCYSTVAIRISNDVGNVLAVAYATRGWRRRFLPVTWTEFDMKFAAPLTTPQVSATVKAVMLVGYTMWVLQYSERVSRRRSLIGLTMFAVGVIVSILHIVLANS